MARVVRPDSVPPPPLALPAAWTDNKVTCVAYSCCHTPLAHTRSPSLMLAMPTHSLGLIFAVGFILAAHLKSRLGLMFGLGPIFWKTLLSV